MPNPDQTSASQCACGHPSRPGEHSQLHCRSKTTWGALTATPGAPATAARPWTAILCWTPDQNHGRVSVLEARAPVHAVLGRLRSGETPEAVARDFGVTVEAVEVLARLADDLAPDEPQWDPDLVDPDAFGDAGATYLTPSSPDGRAAGAAVPPEQEGGAP